MVTWWNTAIVVIYILFIVLIVAGNLCGILVIGVRKTMHTVTNFFIVSLCCADLVIGGFVIPLTVRLLLGKFKLLSHLLLKIRN